MKKLQNIFKPSILLTLAVIMVLSPLTTKAADISEEKNEIVSFDEYYTILKSEYEKYGIELELDQEQGRGMTFTQEFLSEELDRVREECKSLIEEQTESEGIEIISISPRAGMPVSAVNYSDHKIKGTYYEATIRVQARFHWDAQNNKFTGVSEVTSFQNGKAISFVSWKQTEKSTGISSDKKRATAVVKGTYKFSYTHPVSKLKYTVTDSKIYGVTKNL